MHLIKAIVKADLKFGGQYYSNFEYLEDNKMFETEYDTHLTLFEAVDSLITQAKGYNIELRLEDFVIDMLEGTAICDISEKFN